MKGTLRFTVAAKNNGQPLITPGFQMVENTLAPIPTTNTSRYILFSSLKYNNFANALVHFYVIKRERGVNPRQSRCCKLSFAAQAISH